NSGYHPCMAISHAQGACAQSLLGETIGANLLRTVERWPDAPALIVRGPNQRYQASYRDLWDQVTQAALALLALGIEKGDRVAIRSPNRFEWVVLQYASARIGAILVNINPAYRAVELEFALNQSGVRLLFLSRGFRQTDYRPMLEEVRPRCKALQRAL